jgi:hypothetical protein
MYSTADHRLTALTQGNKMKAYDLYGFKGLTLDQARSVVEQALGVHFVPHESSHWGEYYKSGGFVGETIKIRPKYDAENECIEEGFKEYDVLLYVDETERADVLREVLTSPGVAAAFLRHEDL